MAQAAVNARNPFVAGVRSRTNTTTPNEPIASATSTVQLISERFAAICWEATARVYPHVDRRPGAPDNGR